MPFSIGQKLPPFLTSDMERYMEIFRPRLARAAFARSLRRFDAATALWREKHHPSLLAARSIFSIHFARGGYLP
jgi:hypothetical protein